MFKGQIVLNRAHSIFFIPIFSIAIVSSQELKFPLSVDFDKSIFISDNGLIMF